MTRKNLQKLALLLFISLANFWIWRLFNSSFILAMAVLVLTVFLIFRLKILTALLFSALSIFLLVNTYDTNLKYISPLENDRLVHQQEYFAGALGKLFKNRIALYLHYEVFPYVAKYEKNLAYTLDPNQYFFKSHPRERGGIVEFEKFSPLLLPFFIMGIILLVTGGFNFLVVYLTISQLVSAFLFPGYDMGPVLIFPFIVSMIYIGVSKVLRRTI